MAEENIPDTDEDDKPTPGPWCWTKEWNDDGSRYDELSNMDGDIVAAGYVTNSANAWMIQAAPDMLKELKIARATIASLVKGIKRRDEEAHVNPGWNPDYTTQIDVVISAAEGGKRAAIAKAEGTDD